MIESGETVEIRKSGWDELQGYVPLLSLGGMALLAAGFAIAGSMQEAERVSKLPELPAAADLNHLVYENCNFNLEGATIPVLVEGTEYQMECPESYRNSVAPKPAL